VDLGERREGQALRIFRIPALELLDLAKCHQGSAVRESDEPWEENDLSRCGKSRESSEPPLACQLLSVAPP
jgi:hypothetical protein